MPRKTSFYVNLSLWSKTHSFRGLLFSTRPRGWRNSIKRMLESPKDYTQPTKTIIGQTCRVQKALSNLDSGSGVKRMSSGLSASFFESRFDRGLSYLALAIEAKHAGSREMQLGSNAQICGFDIARIGISSKTNGAFYLWRQLRVHQPKPA